MWYGKNGLFYYKSIQDCRSYDLQNIGLKIHNFSLELKQSKTPPGAPCWIIATLVRHYVFFNPRFCKSWDWPNLTNPRNNPRNFLFENWTFWKKSVFESAILKFVFEKKNFFCFIPMKISQSCLSIKDGSKFWWLPW